MLHKWRGIIDCILTLEIPKVGKHSVAIAATTDRDALIVFKRSVIAGYANALNKAENETERLFRQSQLEHMKHVLDVIIPEP